jgi:hypothetical protein
MCLTHISRQLILNKKVQRGDWKRWKRDWPYKGDVKDPVYLMERAEFFKENGNGWWWYQGYHIKK